MKRDLINVPFVILGVGVGYYVGISAELSGWRFYFEIVWGALVGLGCGMALLEKYYGAIIGGVIGLVVESTLDLLAGSPIVPENKLLTIYLFSLVGMYFPIYLRQMIVGGVIGGAIGFGWGLISSHQFGRVCLAPGLFTALLMFIAFFAPGMLLGKLYMMMYGYRFLK